MERTDNEKLPPLFRRHVRRPRLTRLLDETSAQAIVLTAPAGYGKTTLAAEWLQGRDNVVWYRATAASQDVAALASELARVLRPLGTFDGRLEERLSFAPAPENPERTLAELVAAALQRWHRDDWLVIDDYHLVARSAVAETFIDWLMALSPIRVLVTTRRRPAWATARRTLNGEVLELHREQLVMRSDEAAEVLKGVPRKHLQTLIDSADGWPAVIGLAASAAIAAVPKNVAGKVLYRYLAEELVRQEEVRVQELMAAASVLPAADAKTCAAIFGETAAADIGALADRGLLYRVAGTDHFHPLLRAFLLTRLDASTARKSEIVDRVVRYYQENARWDEAFEVLISAGRRGDAAGVLANAGHDLLQAGRIHTIERWFAACGSSSYAPAARLLRAEAMLRRGRVAEARVAALDVLRGLAPCSPKYWDALFVLGRAAQLKSDYDNALQYHQDALTHAEDDHQRREALWGALVAAVELDHPQVEPLLAEFELSARPEVDDRLRLATAYYLVRERGGSLRGVWPRVAEVAPLASHCSDPMIKTNALVNFACLAATRADFSTARSFAEEAVTVAREMDLEFAIGFGLAARAEAEAGLRDVKASQRTLDELEAVVEAHEDPHLAVALETQRLRLQLVTGQSQLSRSTRHKAFDASRAPVMPYAEYLALQSLLMSHWDDHALARAAASTALGMSKSVTVVQLVRWSQLIINQDSLANHTQTLAQELESAVREAAATDSLGVLVWAYRAAPELLHLVEAGTREARIVASVVRRANDVAMAAATGATSIVLDGDSHHDLLTPREREVHRLLLRGLSNADIAARLVISDSTAKVHVHRVLRKLGKTRRIEVLLDDDDSADAT